MEVVLSKRGDLGIDCFNYEGLTPLMLCAEGQATIAKVLLKNGADPNIRDQKSGRTALFHGLEANNGEDQIVFVDIHSKVFNRFLFIYLQRISCVSCSNITPTQK